ncbi:DUF2007 domain-containing protein [Acinetobacter silvestris]|uniref:Phosphoenolpyruvate synthase n=1 Tax=Acinetobacter silvestris TaxID=1977882 RepID=A0A1Y3CKM2_9GAMM|nr:DUF2007 domain-containing protein [Acinetobacter silvestris]OTG67679.1 phosphoenolpyruvate synthase [Acinetobacter silvestris]
MGWVVIESYSFPYEAQIAKAKLDSCDIPSYIENEHTINMNWLYSNAIGGVRLAVPESFKEEAYSLIHQDFSHEVVQHFEIPVEHCPACGSPEIEPYTQGKRSAFLVFIFLGFPLFFYKHGLRCKKCLHFYSDQ